MHEATDRTQRAAGAADPAAAVRQHGAQLLAQGRPDDGLAARLCEARRAYRAARQGKPVRLAVCGWEMSHNAAGRVRCLADLYAPQVQTEIIGALMPEWGGALWPPVCDDKFPTRLFRVDRPRDFAARAMDLVLAHPYDVVHLSKPRMPNILTGLLYKILWDAKVIMDVDDEELGFVGGGAPLPPAAVEGLIAEDPDLDLLYARDWTRLAVGLAGAFDGVTLSNAALRHRHDGQVIPHARPAAAFAPSPARRAASRRQFGIPAGDLVFLFLGTPRARKGVAEAARAIARLGHPDARLVIAGDFTEPGLRQEIEAVEGLRTTFLPGQPYARLPDVVALGDACILLQKMEDLAARYQLPAKLVDALAMGLVAFVTPTPALRDLLAAGAAVAVEPQSLEATVSRHLADPALFRRQAQRGRDWFLSCLSSESFRPTMAGLARPLPARPLPALPQDAVLPDPVLQNPILQDPVLQDMARALFFAGRNRMVPG